MQLELYADALKRATERTLDVPTLITVAGQFTAANQAHLVAALYRTWLEYNGAAPLAQLAYFNYGVLLSGLNDIDGAKQAYAAAIKVKPDFFPPYINLGLMLDRLGQPGEAIAQWMSVVNALPAVSGENITHKTAALKQMGRVLERVNWDVYAEDALRQGLEIDPHQPDVIQHWVSLRQRQCKWPIIQPWAHVTRRQLLEGMSPLTLSAYTDDPLFQLSSAHHYAKTDLGLPDIHFLDHHDQLKAAPSLRRRIGYLSSDFREHAVGFLTAEVFGLHDRSKFEVFLYYCGIPSDDAVHHRIKDSAEHWIDISGMSDREAAEKIVADRVEILVDLNGYTNSARTKVFAMRPAPIIVNWLGYPGTLGTPYHNYIIADDFIIPPSDEAYYSEKVKRIPCYQPNNRKRVIAAHRPTRVEAGLPADAVVYCCFNGVHKITQFTWARWMTILKAVPGSVLWLLDSIEATNTRLKELASAHGVAPERIVFAAKQLNAEHLSRYPCADLFLDTAPYGAHTTSSDALWMGVPVLTLAGRGFASRVCGSLIRSAGLQELICTDAAQYVRLAIELGTDRAKLKALRKKLAEERDRCVLFDTPLLVASLEKIYGEMWNDFKVGRVPVPDLTNLDVYGDIGISLDRDDVELMTVRNYLELYRERLEERHRYAPLRPDSRLWSAEAINELRAGGRRSA